MRVSIIGTGYVGLVTGACLADKGHQVVCVDLDPGRVAALNSATSPIYEPGLEELLRKHVGRNLRATTDLESAVRDSELTLIAVGTPFLGDAIDLGAVSRATREIGAALRSKDAYHVVVVKSTVVPGTTETVVVPLLEEASAKRAGEGFGVGMNPEFLSEGQAIQDFLNPDRIVVGGIDQRSADALLKLYEGFPDDVPRLCTNPGTAEMIKYASNALLALLISFSNELANLGQAIGGIDTVDVMKGVHLSQYFKVSGDRTLPDITSFLKAGCGFGGSCLPKDVSALIAHGRTIGASMAVLDAVLKTNREQPTKMIALLKKHWPDLRAVRVSVLGLAFKPETSDVRESPAFPIIRALLGERAIVTAFDPVANAEAAKVLAGAEVSFAASLDSALKNADAVVVVTPWRQFADLPARLRDRDVVLVDGRRAFDRRAVRRYEGIGL